MANSPEDSFKKSLNQNQRQFKHDVLAESDPSQWPDRIDYISHRVAQSEYTVGIQTSSPYQITGGSTLDDAASEYYLRGIAALTGNTQYRTALPDELRLGTLLVEFAELIDGMEDVRHESLEPGEVLGRLVTRNLKRNTSNEEANLVEELSTDIQTPRALVAELCAVPEIATAVNSALPDQRTRISFVDQLAHVDLTTQLWDHQFEALLRWIEHGFNGYVNMATATGKTVLGLAAVAYCVDAGSLHPADQARISNALGDAAPPAQTTAGKNVLIVTTDDLLGVQWGRLFQTHCHTPPEFTKVTDSSITLPWGRIDIRSAGGIDNLDPADYGLAIFDEVHNYTAGEGWGAGLRRFINANCPVLALTGSETTALKRLTEEIAADFPKVYTYTHTQALTDGIIPDFEWTLTFAGIDSDSSTLPDLKETADLVDGVIEFRRGGVSVSATALEQRFEDLDAATAEVIAGEYETGTRFAKALRAAGEGEGVAPIPALETLASGLSNRSIQRLNLDTDYETVIKLAEDALDRGRPVLILTQSYSEAKELWKALYERDGRLVERIERDASPATQDKTITEFDAAETDRKVLIGPGNHIGQGNDIQSVAVGINISRPGSGVNASLIQRLGRLLRKAGGKEQVEFYHISGVQPGSTVIEPDGESFVRNVTEFFAQAHTPGTDGIDKPPQIKIANDSVVASVRTLEDAGAPRVHASEQVTELEAAYASAIADHPSDETPVVATEWYTDAFPERAGTTVDSDGDSPATSSDSEASVKSVRVDPVVRLVAQLHAERSDKYDSVGAVADDALDSFLDVVFEADAPTQGAFELTTDRNFGFVCDTALEVAIELKIEATPDVETVDEFVEFAMADWLGVDPDANTIELSDYTLHQAQIERLLTDSAYPCTEPGEVVQAALEAHFEI